MSKKEEANDIVQYLLPQLENLEIPRENCKIDVTTEKSGKQRGDIWISLKKHSGKDFESNIIALIEAKHKNATIGDMDWRDAMRHGKEKALKQKLNYYIATNCKSEVRFYNTHNDEEIIVDGKILTKLVSLEILQKIQSQVSLENSYIVHKASKATRPYSEAKFRMTLKRLADVYRSAGLKKGDERIDPTVSFVVLKHISDQETENRTLNKNVELWDDLRDIALGKEIGDLRAEFDKMVNLIWGKKSQYEENVYKDFKDLIVFPDKLKNEHFKKIYNELDVYPFHGAYFDLFGAIYEEFASRTKKKEFGEFYTRRHIANTVTKLLLRNEINPRDLKICDPACGTGGFLTEAFKTLCINYSLYRKLSKTAINDLKTKTFWGFDNDEKSIARTKLNMFLVGDGHIHIYENDSLIGWNEEIGWKEDEFDYIMTNPPMGQYEGAAKIGDFDFTNESRYELLFLEKVFLATKPSSEIAIVINDGALEAPTRENFRKKVLENCNVLAILSLTKFAFAPYTKEKTYVLFMQKKSQDEDKEIQKTPIWHYILDYDGFANSDKRYRTKYHDDIPELEEKFDGAIKLLRLYSANKNEFEQNRVNFEREVNNREKDEGLSGWKYKYVEMDKVNKENFLNLLSEFHLRPVEIKKVSEKDFDKQIKDILKDHLVCLKDNLKQTTEIITSTKGETCKLNEILIFRGGNSGLTEEFMYSNQPYNEDEKIPILSGATLKINLMGYIGINARPNDKKLKIFSSPCILLIRKGNAGLMRYIKNGKFATNDDAYVLIPKKEWRDKINLRWFVHRYQELFYNLVTSKSGNATFNKEYAEKQEVMIPKDIDMQNKIAERLLKIDDLIENLEKTEEQINILLGYEI